MLPNVAQKTLTSRYDPAYDTITSDHTMAENDVIFQNVVVTDVDIHASSAELQAAALCHVKVKGGAYICLPHEPQPVNEFCNLSLFPMMYPTLFSYGVGGFENPRRQ